MGKDDDSECIGVKENRGGATSREDGREGKGRGDKNYESSDRKEIRGKKQERNNKIGGREE